jgi:hypothetical protein
MKKKSFKLTSNGITSIKLTLNELTLNGIRVHSNNLFSISDLISGSTGKLDTGGFTIKWDF